MIKYFKILLIAFVFLLPVYANSQFAHPKFDDKKSIKYTSFKQFFLETPWDIQYGWNVVDDDGRPFRKLLNVSKGWNIGFVPSRIGITKKINKLLKGELDLSFNKFRANKIVNNELLNASGSFFSMNLGVQADLNRVFGYTSIIDPYALGGLGYTRRTISKYKNTITFNIGFGANIWFGDNVGAFIQSEGRIGFKSPFIRNPSNYFQHSLGAVFKISGISSKFHMASVKLKNTYKKTHGRIRAKF